METTTTRRQAVLMLGALGGATIAAAAGTATRADPIRAVAFDAFAIFDPRPVFGGCEALFPGRGTDLAATWRTRLFEYQWLRALGGRYVDFEATAAAALDFAATTSKLQLSPEQRSTLLAGFQQLHAWPDVAASLAALKSRGLRIALLSNATPRMLAAGLKQSNLEAAFDEVISTDRARTFKPDPRAYRLGVELLRERKSSIAFVAFAGWDAAGARWFGYPTFWNNRMATPEENLDGMADASGASLDALVRWLAARSV
jgi:2-haloacid dehalogenase